jgi:hypothetical protein
MLRALTGGRMYVLRLGRTPSRTLLSSKVIAAPVGSTTGSLASGYRPACCDGSRSLLDLPPAWLEDSGAFS